MQVTSIFWVNCLRNRLSTSSFLLLILSAPSAHAGILNPGQTETIDNTAPVEDWTLQVGSTLIANGATTNNISATSATFVTNGASTQQLLLQTNSVMTMTGGTVTNTTGSGAAATLVGSSANITNGTLTSNGTGISLTRNIQDQIGSSATLNNTTVIGDTLGALVNGLGVINLNNGSTVTATGATSSGMRLLDATLSASDSAITGGQNGILIGTEPTPLQKSIVNLSNSTVQGGTGSAIAVGFLNFNGANVDINVLNGSKLLSGNGNVLEVKNLSTVNLNVDSSDLAGNVVVADGSTVTARLQNGATLTGDLQNVANTILDTRSSLTGNVLATAGSGATVQVDNASTLIGNVNNASRLSLDHGATMTGNVSADASGEVSLDNSSTLTGRIDNSTRLGISNGAQWVMTGNSSAQNLALNGGTVRMGGNNEFHQLNVVNLSGNGTFAMSTDLSNGNTDFLNVTGTATGQHQLQVAASGNNPLTADPVKIGNIVSGDAGFSLVNGKVDAGAFTYKLLKDNEGLFLRPDAEVSTSTNSVLAIAATAPSVLYGEMTTLNSRLGDRRLNSGGADNSASTLDSSTKNLSNGVWMRTFGNQYNVANAYGDGYTQRQNGFSLGADTQTQMGGQQWLVGAFVGSSRTDLDLKQDSSATIDSLNAGVYGRLLNTETGVYIDLVGKVNQFDNSVKVTMSDGTRTKGSYKSLGVSGSVEVGKHIRFDEGYFVEPYVQMYAASVQGKQYHLDNDMQVDADKTRSLLGKVGTSVGRQITLANGSILQPRVRAALSHEFVNNNQVEVNDSDFNNDLSTTSVEYGAGVNWLPTRKNWQIYAELGGSKGKVMDQNWNASAGISYSF